MDRAWQRMLSGRRLDLLDPSPFDVELDDIAHGLSRVAAIVTERAVTQAGDPLRHPRHLPRGAGAGSRRPAGDPEHCLHVSQVTGPQASGAGTPDVVEDARECATHRVFCAQAHCGLCGDRPGGDVSRRA